MAKDFDEMMRDGEITNAARLFARQYYDSGKMGHARKMLIDTLADKVDLYEKPCEYCGSIDNSTSNSPRRKYKFCPMCGKPRA